MARGRKPKINFDEVDIVVVKANEPNSGNPYTEWSYEERMKRLHDIYITIYHRRIENQKHVA